MEGSANNAGYPWEDTDGLSPVLSDKRFWRIFFDSITEEEQRFLSEKLKDALRSADIYKRERHRDLTAGICDALGSARARHALDSARATTPFRPWLAEQIYRNVQAAKEKGCPQFLPALCDQANDEKWYLNPQKFEQWLRDQSLDDPSVLRLIAICTAAFAVVQTDLAGQFRDILITRDERFRSIIDLGRTTEGGANGDHGAVVVEDDDSRSSKSLSAHSGAKISSDVSPALGAVTAAVGSGKPPERDAAAGMDFNAVIESVQIPCYDPEKHSEDTARQLVGSLRRLTATVRQGMKPFEDAVKSVDRIRCDAEEKIQQVRIAIAAIDPDVELLISQASSDQPIQSLLREWSAVGAAAALILENRDRLNYLEQQCGVVQPVPMPAKATCAQVAAAFDEATLAVETKWEVIRDRQRNVGEFLDQICGPDIDGVDRIVDESKGDARLWGDLFETALMQDAHKGASARLHRLDNAPDLWGALTAMALSVDADRCERIIESVFSRRAGEFDGEGIYRLFQYVDPGQLSRIAHSCPSCCEHVAALIGLSALAAPTERNLGHLESFALSQDLPAGVQQVMVALHDDLQAGLSPWNSATSAGRRDGAARVDAQKDAVLAWIKHEPGQKGKYHSLLVSAHAHFIKDLGSLVVRGKFEEAVAEWHQTDIATMVEITERADKGRGRDAQNSHLRKLRQFLENFGGELEKLARLASEVADPVNARLPAVVESLQRDHSLCPRWLLGTLGDVRLRTSEWRRRLASVGDEVACADAGGVLLDAEFGGFRPRMLLSWPHVASGRDVPLALYAADLLRIRLSAAESDEAAVAYFLRHEKYREARKAAEYVPALRHDVEQTVAVKGKEVRARWQESLEKGATLRSHDASVEACMKLFEEECDALQFDEADTAASMLQEVLREFEVRESPTRRMFAKLLEEAGETVEARASESQLAAQWEIYKALPGVVARRRHIVFIQNLLADSVEASLIAAAFSDVMPRIDRPSRWLQPDLSNQLAEHLRIVCDFMQNRCEFAQDPVDHDLVLQRVCEWIPIQLASACSESSAAGETVIRAIGEVAVTMQKPGVPDGYILRVIGKAEVPVVTRESAANTWREDGKRGTEKPADHASDARVEAVAEEWKDAREPPAFIREQMEDDAANAATDAVGSFSRLRLAVRSGNWRQTRALLASAYRTPPSDFDFDASFVLDAYSLALVASTGSADAALFEKIALYAGGRFANADHDQLRSCFSREWVDGLIAWMLASIARQPETVSLRDSTGIAVETLKAFVDPGAAESCDAGRWLRNLFMKAGLHGNASAVASLALSLWNVVTGSDKAARPRHGLLNLLYRNRHDKALKELSEKVVKDTTVRSLIVTCLETFRRGETDRESYLHVRQRFDAFSKHSAGVKNNVPWFELFSSLLQERESVTSGESLQWALESTAVGFVGAQEEGVIEVRFTPSHLDPVRQLKVRLGDDEEDRDLLEGDFLIEDRVLSIAVPRRFIRPAGDMLRIPFRLRGATVSDRDIDIRGSWDLPDSIQTLDPLEIDEIERLWPGNSGRAVRSEHGFYGRENERKQIEAALHAAAGPKSVMVLGERRIGKTSLLLECVRRMPSEERGIYGLFLDVSGLPLGDGLGAMSQALFDAVVSAIFQFRVEEGDRILRVLRENNAGQSIAAIKADLVAGIDARQSFSHALEELAMRLEEKSSGQIRRVCVVIDEFDRFVECLQDQKAEVERLMWGLRSIVMVSQKIALVLAGSGLLNVFTEDYGKALWGSIMQVTVGAFDARDDREAIEDTFLPKEGRQRLCMEAGLFEQVIKRAMALSMGHPYYLAMLGYSAAVSSRGHRFTPALLNRVTDLMMRERVNQSISPKKFFGHTFETLGRLDDRIHAIAKIIVAHVAESTTSEFPWLQVVDALRAPELEVAAVTSRDRSEAFSALKYEHIIEEDAPGARVRVRVPLTAAALRAEGPRLRRESVIVLEDERRLQG